MSVKFGLTSRKIIRRFLLAVGILTVVAAGFMLFTAKTANEKVIDIVVLLIGSIALVMAILTEAELERHSKKFNSLHLEISEAIDELRTLNKTNQNIEQKLKQEIKNDQKLAEKIDKIISE